jgi:acetyltransferase-like isoleucine patch superfamily enzyme
MLPAIAGPMRPSVLVLQVVTIQPLGSKDTTIRVNAIIGANVTIGKSCRMGHHVVIGDGVTILDGTVVRNG